MLMLSSLTEIVVLFGLVCAFVGLGKIAYGGLE